jgi:hypothetical protein
LILLPGRLAPTAGRYLPCRSDRPVVMHERSACRRLGRAYEGGEIASKLPRLFRELPQLCFDFLFGMPIFHSGVYTAAADPCETDRCSSVLCTLSANARMNSKC